MFYLIYSSYAAKPLSDEQLTALLTPSRQRNRFKSITGVLYYFDGKFIQLIEGYETDVKLLYGKIYNDPRHQNIQLHKEGEIESRNFPDWTMAFKPVLPDNTEGVHGFMDMSKPDRANLEGVMRLYKILEV